MFAKFLGDQMLASKLEGAGLYAANPKFFYSITRDSAKKRLYLKLVNASSAPQPLDLDIAGAKLAETGTLVTLKANSTQETNSIDHPTQIVPFESPLHSVANHLHLTVPGYAIQVVQLDEK
jgi:alpha-N-arabinofuranosidase